MLSSPTRSLVGPLVQFLLSPKIRSFPSLLAFGIDGVDEDEARAISRRTLDERGGTMVHTERRGDTK